MTKYENLQNAMAPRRRSAVITPEMRAKIKELLEAGFMQHDIAAIFGINQGRVSEVKNGKR